LLTPAVAGLLMEAEIDALSRLLAGARSPYLAILGGAKISGKIDLIENLLARVNGFLIGGAMAYTFLRARGIATGRSLVEEDRVGLAGELLTRAAQQGIPIHLPVDHVAAASLEAASTQITPGAEIPAGLVAGDIGPRTVQAFAAVVAGAETVLWNGPMGVFEQPAFAAGTRAVGMAVAACRGFTVVGGGDSAAAGDHFGLGDRFGHISTGGGARLELRSGRTLPGPQVLDDAEDGVGDPGRRPWVVANGKMNLDLAGATALAEAMAIAPVCAGGIEVLLAPAFPHLAAVAARLAGSPVGLSAQDLHWEPRGAFTGAVSAPMLADVGATHVLVGHSERRRLFADTDEVVCRKLGAAVAAGLIPIVCVGEDAAQRDAGRAADVVRGQLTQAQAASGWPGAAGPILAYEPVWAIGTGRVARAEQAAEIPAVLRAAAGSHARILYGGSVSSENAGELMAEPEIDGLLVGGASLNAPSFLAVVAAARRRDA
jgi:triosephosphate isomerase